ncbi:uncharacterized protein [Antennarius striatus]|uniref:uncharacterized protein isoform X2 n=1 Tax=Antennarius striatus TaxID=241820 RepID=UPI0035B44420
MELPLGGPALRHYTQSRPRPHRQKLNYRPSRPQETIIESENEVLELMGRVDEGVEEFFTKRVLPTDALTTQDEESIIVHEVVPASSVPCPPQTKTLRRKLGDFFTLKKRRGLKSETSQEGRPKKASIADFIRPLREVGRADKEKDKDRVKEHDKENEKEKAKEHPIAVAGDTADQETPGAPPMRGEGAPPRRALREGKSQSLILLSGSSAAGTTNARNTAKKQFEGQHSFEQKLHLMLQRIGVSKAQPGETQNQEGEMKKAESEGTIIDNKPEAPSTFTKPRTMSASSDTRHQIRASVSAHESAGKPALLPKPVLKPGPPPTTSGRNTPENELAEIQEGDSNTPPEQSPIAAPCLSSSTAPPTTTSPTLLTISSSVPDSTNVSTSPSSTVLTSDTEICTDINATASATPTKVTELNDKPSTPEFKATTTATITTTTTTTMELPTTSSPTTITSPATPTEFPTTVSLVSAASESVPRSHSDTSNPTTVTLPSVPTSETVSVPCDESPIFTSTNLPTRSTFPEPNGVVSVDATLHASASVVATDSFSPTITSDPCGTTTSVTESSDDVASDTTSVVTLVSSVIKATSPSSDLVDIAKPESPMVSSSSLVSSAPPPSSSTSDTTATASPTSTNDVESVSASAVSQTAIPSSADISSPSTSSSETNPTDTTTTTTSLNRADTTSTTSSATAAAISSPLQTDSDPPYPNDTDTAPTPTISSLPPIVNSSSTDQVSSPALSSQVYPEERPCLEPAKKATDEAFEVVQTVKELETDESKRVGNVGNENEKGKDISASVDSAEILNEVPEESVKEGMKIELVMAEPASGKDGVPSSSEKVIEDHKPEETKTVHEK